MNDTAFDDNQKHISQVKQDEEESLVRTLALSKYHLPYIQIKGGIIDNEAIHYIPLTDSRRLGMGAFRIEGKKLSIGILSPNNPEIMEYKKNFLSHGIIPTFYLISHASLEKIQERYSEISDAETSVRGIITLPPETLREYESEMQTLTSTQKYLAEIFTSNNTKKTTKIIETILYGGLLQKASDIHIEPEEDSVRLRYRIDGVLEDILFFTTSSYLPILSRIKLHSKMKLTKNIEQDGRFSFVLGNLEIDFRVSIIPGSYGESIVMRILDPRSLSVHTKDLGIPENLFSLISTELKKPNSLILISGPTGSGKTTTLYSFLKDIQSTEKKMLTIEDPVEYRLDGITQTQVDMHTGYTFAEGLRSALRQDPDVIMVGEIRDKETAETAIQASLTGHLVFSTIHTNTAAGVIPRLIDLGVNPKTLSSALGLCLAQRLVRKVCTHCTKKRKPTQVEFDIIRTILTPVHKYKKTDLSSILTPDFTIPVSVGCEICGYSGYKGRIGIFEGMQTTHDIIDIIPENPSEYILREKAHIQGFFTLAEDGILKVLQGITTIEELSSSVSLSD
jgi:type IV pilus assembly protein PilB